MRAAFLLLALTLSLPPAAAQAEPVVVVKKGKKKVVKAKKPAAVQPRTDAPAIEVQRRPPATRTKRPPARGRVEPIRRPPDERPPEDRSPRHPDGQRPDRAHFRPHGGGWQRPPGNRWRVIQRDPIQRDPIQPDDQPDHDAVDQWQATRERVVVIAESRPALVAGRGVSASSGTAQGTWITPPVLIGTPEPEPPPAIEAAAPAAAWQVDVDGSLAWHSYHLLDTKDGTWAGVNTTERYAIEALLLYRAALQVHLPHATLGVGYESNAGFNLGVDPSTLLDLLVTFVDAPGLDRLYLAHQRLDFDHGHVALVSRAGGEDLENARFSMALQRYEVGFKVLARLALFARYQTWTLPRAVYLAEDRGSGVAYHQVSDQLLNADQDLWLLGLSLDSGRPVDSGLSYAFALGFGAGTYRLQTLTGGTALDHGGLEGGQLTAALGYQQRLAPWAVLGVRNEAGLQWVDPSGLPAGLRADLKQRGLNADAYALTFGSVEVVNTVQIYAGFEL